MMSWFDTSAIFRMQKRLICVALNKERDFFYSFPYRLVHVEFLYDIVFHCCRSVAKPAPAAKGGSRRRLPPPAPLPLFFLLRPRGAQGGFEGAPAVGGLQPPAPPVAPPLSPLMIHSCASCFLRHPRLLLQPAA
jgi:hypothetical protein